MRAMLEKMEPQRKKPGKVVMFFANNFFWSKFVRNTLVIWTIAQVVILLVIQQLGLSITALSIAMIATFLPYLVLVFIDSCRYIEPNYLWVVTPSIIWLSIVAIHVTSWYYWGLFGITTMFLLGSFISIRLGHWFATHHTDEDEDETETEKEVIHNATKTDSKNA